MFVLTIVSVILVVGTFFRMSISNIYIKEFRDKAQTAFKGEFISQISDETEAGADAEKIAPIIDAYAGRLGVDMYRSVYLLDGRTGAVLYRTDGAEGDSIEKTPNIITALAGKEGGEISDKTTYMDFAVPVTESGEVKYVVYMKDTKEELSEIVGSILAIILQALMFGLLISCVLGFVMSRTITSPIISLTHKAERLSEGDFGARLESRADDEIGQLTNAFNKMATEIKSNLQAIENEKNKVETILMFMTDGVMAFDGEGKVIHINHAAERILGMKMPEDAVFDEFFKHLDMDISVSEIVFSENKAVERELVIGDRHASVFFAATAPAPGGASAIIVVLRDTTEQHKLELSRREFVSNVSHELRTPITTIKSYTETILESPDIPPETRNNFLNVVLKESDRMTRLVYDLLELSRLENDKQSMPKEIFDLKELMTYITDKLSFEADTYNHKIELSFAGDLSRFYGNKDRIEQVITNIITNAIKYTPPGGLIKVSAGKVYNSIYIKVKDNGIGIPEDDLPHIFERFYRVDKARSRQSGGTGLGLAIANEIVQAHGGKMKVKSKQGEGTEFIITFSCKEDVTLS